MWGVGDRVFLWESAPGRRIVGLAEIVKIRARKRAGKTAFDLVYLTGRLARPLAAAELAEDDELARATFLKSGPAQCLTRLTRAQAQRLRLLVAAANPPARSILRRWEGETGASETWG
jgi:hypothetical protein